MLGRAREDVRRQDVDGGFVGVEGGFVGGGDLRGRLRFKTGSHEHPILPAVEPLVAQVTDVGHVLHVEDLQAVVQERATDEVGEQVAAQIADVGIPVDRRAAAVHPDAAGLQRFDRLDIPGEGVAETDCHSTSWADTGILGPDPNC